MTPEKCKKERIRIGVTMHWLSMAIERCRGYISHYERGVVKMDDKTEKKLLEVFASPPPKESFQIETSVLPPTQEEADKFSIKTVKSANLADLINVHQERVQAFINVGSEPFQEYTQETRLRATELFYASEGSCKYMQSIFI